MKHWKCVEGSNCGVGRSCVTQVFVVSEDVCRGVLLIMETTIIVDSEKSVVGK
jgi:hypothetical protein